MELTRSFRWLFFPLPPPEDFFCDKGFKQIGALLPNNNRVLMPAFKLRGVADFRFSAHQLESNFRFAANRYVVEVAFSRCADYKLVDDEAQRQVFHLMPNALLWANGASVFMAPLQQPEKTPAGEFKSLGSMYFWARSEYQSPVQS